MSGGKTLLCASMFAAIAIAAVAGSPRSVARPGAALAAQSSSGTRASSATGAAAAPQTGSVPSAPSAQPGTGAQAPAAPAAKPAAVADPATAAWKMLTDGLNSDKYPTRSDAIAALAVLDTDRRAVRLMTNALKDKESVIRVQAATSLGEMKARAAIPELRAMLEDKEPQVVFAAAQALWKMGDHSGREIFYEVLDGERKTQPGLIKSNINKAKAEMHDPKGLVLIGINSASSAFLGPGVLGVSAVEELALNSTAPVQALCAKLLGDDDQPETVEELKQALGDKSWTVRAAAARALAKLNHPEALPPLMDMMQNDKKEAARFAAASAVIRLSERRGSKPAASPQAKPQQAPSAQAAPSQPAASAPSATR